MHSVVFSRLTRQADFEMNIIAFRLPGREAIVSHVKKASAPFCEGAPWTFVTAPFSDGAPLFYRPVKYLNAIPEETIRENYKDFGFLSFSYNEYSNYIVYIKEIIGGDAGRKIVASRRESAEMEVTPDALFKTLCREYPDALVFYISTEDFGSWIGASPEVLLERKGNMLRAMSLAGTRPADSVGAWNRKNELEQKIVTDFISSVFEANNIKHKVLPRRTLKTGRIEHLLSIVEGEMPGNNNLSGCKVFTEIERLLSRLSPTPALSGYPRKEAMEVIERFEGNRVLYGGYCGPIEADGDFRMNVILRCAYLLPGGKAVLFAGGGITAMSQPEEEWEETERKFNNLRRFLSERAP